MKLRYYKTESGGELKSEIILSPSEQKTWYQRNLKMIMDNPRWILDNIEHLAEYHVGWNNYGTREMRHKCIKCGKEYSITRRKPCSCGCTKFITVHYGVGYMKDNRRKVFNLYEKDD